MGIDRQMAMTMMVMMVKGVAETGFFLVNGQRKNTGARCARKGR